MSKVTMLNMAGQEVGVIELKDAIFGIEPNNHAIYLDVKQYLNNQRQGTAKTKERWEVSYSTRKLIRQKGSGGARHGSLKANIYVGGGSASVADKAIADGNGRNIVNTYETKANATSNKTELQTNIDTVDAARQLNTTDITNIKNGTTPVGKANYADNPSGNLDVTITNILTDLANTVKRDDLNTNYFKTVNDLIEVIHAYSASTYYDNDDNDYWADAFYNLKK